MPSRQALTVHGEVDYDTVECSSCGNEVLEDESYGFILYDSAKVKKTRSWHDHNEWEVYNGGYKEGHICPFCYDEGPVDYPRTRSFAQRFNSLYESIFIGDVGMWRFGTVVFFAASLCLWVLFALSLLTEVTL